MLNQLNAFIQYLLPKQLLTIMVGWLANRRLGKLTTWIIKGYCKIYKVDLSEAELNDAMDYPTFNDFFARKLKKDARPIDSSAQSIIMPADGTISQFGQIEQNRLIQAKGHYYNLDALIACQPDMLKYFSNGSYVTTYLSPADYHRVHMPCDATLREMIYVPGSLFSVNNATTSSIPNIFARNERIICLFETEFGPMAQILIGATIVGSIGTSWQGVITPPHDSVIKRWTYKDEVKFSKGQEMGYFKLGSTVINLFAANSIEFSEDLAISNKVHVGQKLAIRI